MDDKDLAGSFTFRKVANPKVSFDKISANEYVACYYDSTWWVGLVQNVNCDAKDVEIIFLHLPGDDDRRVLTSDVTVIMFLISFLRLHISI